MIAYSLTSFVYIFNFTFIKIQKNDFLKEDP
jgi:hypothetical protein